MENLQIGKWLINEDGIEWTGVPCTGYYISRERLLQKGFEEQGTYDWLLHQAHKKWLTAVDIYAFNTAFIAALEMFEPNYRQVKLSFVKSLRTQQNIINYKDAAPDQGLAQHKLFDEKSFG